MIGKGKMGIRASQMKIILGLPESAEIVDVEMDGEGNLEIRYVTVGVIEGKSSKARDFKQIRRTSIGLAVHPDGKIEIN